MTGTRKIDVGNVNAVEASVIDTALFQFGAATFASGYAADQEIQDRVRSLLNRTLWDELVDEATGQLQLAWKPELDAAPPPLFTTPAPFGGFWATREGDEGAEALTIDVMTDEGGLAAILAAGSENNAVDAGPWYSMERILGEGPCAQAVVTFPGAWFTSAFLSTTYLDAGLGQDRGPEWGVIPLDWTDNARRIFEGHRQLRSR